MMTTNTTSASSASVTRLAPPNKTTNASAGTITQPKAYRVRAPTATEAPTTAARTNSHLVPHFGSTASLSNSVRLQTSTIKISISSIVERPDTLKRQNNSVPNNNNAESQATEGSNNCRAQKNTLTIRARNRA